MNAKFLFAILFAVVTACGSSLQGAAFQGLGDLPGGSGSTLSTGDTTFESQGIGVSPNGNIVVGKSISGTAPPAGGPPGPGNSEAMKWTAGGGMIGLGADSTASFYSIAAGVSNNDVAIGYGDTSEFSYLDHVLRWTAPSGSSAPERMTMLGLETRQFGYSYSGNHPINGAGNISVGVIAEIPYSNTYEAIVWVNNGTPLKLGWLDDDNGPGGTPADPGPWFPPPQPNPSINGFKDYSFANAINTPGTHIVGSSVSGFADDPSQTDGIDDQNDPNYVPAQAVLWRDPTGLWTTAPTPVTLGQVGLAGTGSSATDITNNGMAVVGSGCTTNDCFDDRLDRNGLLQPGPPFNETSTGFIDTWTGTSVAFVGTVGNTNLMSLGTLPVSNPNAVAASAATAIAGNGTTVVGWSVTSVPDQVVDYDPNNPAANPSYDKPENVIKSHEAFIWDSALTGGVMVKLQDFLIAQGLGAQLAGWTLKEANDISDDGTVIVGTGINPSGNYEAFRAVIDLIAPETGDFNDDGIVNAADYVTWRKINNTPSGYDAFRENFGEPVPGGGGSFSGERGSIPEPSSILLMLTAFATMRFRGMSKHCRR